MNCGSPTKETFAKFCPTCGKPFLDVSKSSVKPSLPPKQNVYIENDDEDDSSSDTNINIPDIDKKNFGAEDVEIENIENRKQTFRSLENAKKTGFIRDIPESKTKRKKDKNFKEKVWQDFAKEAGTLRKSNKKSE